MDVEERKVIIEKLRDDENYYGDFGKQFLSNSNIKTLLEDPLALRNPIEKTTPMLVGGYFHTAILEPHKLGNYKVIDSSTRNTNKYKEISGGELCLLQKEVDLINELTDKLLQNEICKDLIMSGEGENEVPGLIELEGLTWKCKADRVLHSEKLVLDLKTTADITKFKNSAYIYNYDSQAYIYSSVFGYDMIFIVVCKKTQQIGIFDCSPEFIERGKAKVKKAADQYKLFYQDEDFNPRNYFINETL